MLKLVFQEMWFVIIPMALVLAVLLVAFPKVMLIGYFVFVLVSEIRHRRYMKKRGNKPWQTKSSQ